MAKKKPLKKDRKAGRGNLPAQKQPFYLQAQQQRKPKPKKQREDWDEPAIEPGEYPVSCDRMDEQGSGVVYLEGEKLPVDGLLPGEQAVVEVFGKRNLHARLLQIKKASSKRVKPQCPAFAKCGGCKMQHLQYDSQLEWKQKTVEQLMKHYIDEGAKLYQIVGMVEPWRYRNKCHISFGMNGRRQIISGIYEENSHRVVPVESCLIQDSKADEIARSVRAIMKECKLLPYDEDSETGLLRHLLVRTGFASGHCAAPGSKTFTIAQQMQGEGQIISCDIFEEKVKKIQAGAARLGLSCVDARLQDASVYDPQLGEFDRVLCDAPCSGIGIIGRKPEIKYKEEAQLSDLPQLQLKILENVCRYVKVGGRLVYSTCTLLPNENTKVVEQFLQRHSEFEPLILPQRVLQAANSTPTWALILLPQMAQTDGFFIAGMKRVR